MLKNLLRRKTDAELITSTRRLVEFWDRYRVLVTIGGIGIIGFSFWYLATALQGFKNFNADHPFAIAQLNRLWMLVSLILGIGIGLNFAGILSYLGKSIFGGYRVERLLLRLHAELKSSKTDEGKLNL